MTAKSKAQQPQQPATSPEKPITITSMATKAAMAELDAAAKVLTERRQFADRIGVEIQAATASLAALESLDALDQTQALELTNTQRRLRRLRADHQVALGQVAEASKPVRIAQRRLDAAKLVDADHELQTLDAQFVTKARAFSAELAGLRRTIFAKLRIANGLYRALTPSAAMDGDSPRSTTAGLGSPGDDALIAAARAIEVTESRARQRAENEKIGRGPVNIYRPPRGPQGEFETN